MSLIRYFLLLFILVPVLFLLTVAWVFAGTLPSNLTWSNTDNVNKIQIVKAPSLGGIYVEIAQVPAASTTYTDATNTPNDTACYKAAYINSSGVGPSAGPVCKTFPPVPVNTPQGLTVN